MPCDTTWRVYCAFLILQAFLLFFAVPAFAATPERIVSLAPNITEILFDLGLGDRVAAVTSFCDYPPEARKKRKIGGMSNPSLESILSVRPDLVILTTDGNPEHIERKLRRAGIPVYLFSERRLAELPGALRRIGAALGVQETAEKRARFVETYFRDVHAINQAAPTRSALFVIWPDPLIAAGPGTLIDDALKMLNLKNLASDAGMPYPKFSLEAAALRNPDFLFIGKGHDNMKDRAMVLLARIGLTGARAEGKVFFLGDSLYRLGPRVVEGIREITDIISGGRQGKLQ